MLLMDFGLAIVLVVLAIFLIWRLYDLFREKGFWQEEFNVHFPGETIPVTPELMEEGWLVNEDNCAVCHSNPRWAFVSYPVSIAMKPVADFFNRNRLDLLV